MILYYLEIFLLHLAWKGAFSDNLIRFDPHNFNPYYPVILSNIFAFSAPSRPARPFGRVR